VFFFAVRADSFFRNHYAKIRRGGQEPRVAAVENGGAFR
jgi:hypothetical protein